MTGKELKDKVSIIPDDAIVLVAGPDAGGYDVAWHRQVEITHGRPLVDLYPEKIPDPTGDPIWRVQGVLPEYSYEYELTRLK